MKYKYLLTICIFTSCGNKNKHKKTPQQYRRYDSHPNKFNGKTPSPVNPINSSSADYKYEGCDSFPYECLDKDNDIDWNNSEYRKWHNNYMDYLKRNEDKIKQEIKTDVVKAFEKYYQNPKDTNGASVGSIKRKNMFINHFIYDKHGYLNGLLKNLNETQKKQLMNYFKQKNIIPIHRLYQILNEGKNFKELSKNSAAFDLYLDDEKQKEYDQEYKNFMKKYKEKINWNNSIFVMNICVFCGNPMYKSYKKYFNGFIFSDHKTSSNKMGLICLNKECIAFNKIIDDYNFNKILLTKGSYNITAKCNEHVLFENHRQMVKKLILLNIFDMYWYNYASQDELKDGLLLKKLGYKGCLNVIITKNDTEHFNP